MKKPSFKVVTSVVSILVVMAFARNALQPLIPLPEEDRNLVERGDFMRQGSREGVKWLPYSESVFSKARRDSKPVLLVIGQPWSRTGRLFDGRTLSVPKVAALLNREFICVRIDASHTPAWATAFWPLSRFAYSNLIRERNLQKDREDLLKQKPEDDRLNGFIGMPIGCQVWVLDPLGNVIDLIGRNGPGELTDPSNFLASLWAATRRGGRPRLHPDLRLPYQMIDVNQIKFLELVGDPDFANFAAQLIDQGTPTPENSTTPLYFGWPVGKIQTPMPFCWKLLFLGGRAKSAKKTLEPVLRSSMVDLVDGGFFRNAEALDWSKISYDKSATANAEMLDLLVTAWATTHDPAYKWLALRTYEFLNNDLRTGNLVAGGIPGDEGEDGRSAHASFSLKWLKSRLSADDYGWVTSRLGLSPMTNPQMTPLLADLNLIRSDTTRLDRILASLKKANQEAGRVHPTPVAQGLLDINGHVFASLIRAARAFPRDIDSKSLLSETGDLERYIFSDEVIHRFTSLDDQGTYLGDYLAYADFRLADYCLTGYVPSFQKGLAMLQRAIDLYGTDRSGIYNVWNPPLGQLAPRNVANPEISDQVRESCSAQLIRLLNDYGRMLAPTPLGTQLQAKARQIVSRFSSLSEGLPAISAYYCAAASLADPLWAVTAGPNALDLSASLAEKRPTRLVVAASGCVRSDLLSKGPGIYIMRGNVPNGPYTLDQALKELPATYDLGISEDE